jgi:NTE family protein
LRWPLGRLERRLSRLRFHLVDADEELGALPGETKLVAHLPFLLHLRDLGRLRMADWWLSHGASLGRASSADLTQLFAGIAPVRAMAANSEAL